jgi:hypothetical protein
VPAIDLLFIRNFVQVGWTPSYIPSWRFFFGFLPKRRKMTLVNLATAAKVMNVTINTNGEAQAAGQHHHDDAPVGRSITNKVGASLNQ